MKTIRDILEKFKTGDFDLNEVENEIKIFAIEEIENIAKIDIFHEFRQGRPEMINAEGKRPQDIAKIAVGMLNNNGRAIISQATLRTDTIIKAITTNFSPGELQVDHKGRVIIVRKKTFRIQRTGGKIGIVTAGTSDVPVAEEAKVIAEEMGCEVITAYDVGVDALHRLYSAVKAMLLHDVDVIIAIAGKEGTLPNVVAGLVGIQVIGVPTSIGSGFGGKGAAALRSMLQGCSGGIVVVNIDGGVEAAIAAALAANRIAKFRNKRNS